MLTLNCRRSCLVSPFVPELAQSAVVVVLTAHADLECVAVAVADDQPPALGDRAHLRHWCRHRCGHDATRLTSTVVGALVGLGHHGALTSASASDEHEHARETADEHAE